MAITKPNGEITHIGQCLSVSTWYNSSMDITSYYVNVYNPVTGKFESIYVNCDFPSDEKQATYTIDATPEVQAIWKAKQDAIYKARIERDELIALMTPSKGKRLQVIRGRKVPLGTEGMCFWIGNNGYGESVGIKDANGTVYFTASKNVQVV